MPMSLLLISNKKVLSCNWLGTNNNFWCCQLRISGALFEQIRFSFDNPTHVVFWTKVEHFYKNSLKRPVFKSQFQSPRNLVKKNFIFSPFTQKQLEIHDGTKHRLNMLSHQFLGGIIRCTNEVHTFLIRNAFGNSGSVLLNFLINWPSNVAQVLLNTYNHHHTKTITY